MTTLLTLVGALAFLVATPLALYQAYRRLWVGVLLVLIVNFLWVLEIRDEALSVGGISLYPYDFVFALLAACAGLRIAARGTVNAMEIAWLVFLLFLVVAFLRGANVYGLAMAGEARTYMYFAIAVLYCMTADISQAELNAVAKLWIVSATLIAAVGLFDILSGGSISQKVSSIGLSHRSLHAFYAFQIFQGGMISLYLWIVPGTGAYWRYAGIFLLPVVVMLQHRTVWVVALVVLLLVVWREGRISRRAAGATVVAVVAAAVATMMMFAGVQDRAYERFVYALAEPFTDNSTLAWRIAGWQQIFENFMSFDLNMLVGPPAGTARALESQNFIYAHAHSFYLVTLLRTGVVGFGILMATYFFLLRHLRRAGTPAYGQMLSGRTLFLLLVGQLVFSIPYDLSYEQLLLVGTAVALLANRQGATAGREIPQHGFAAGKI